MKKIVSLMGIIALCAASFTACNKVSENDIQEKGKHIIKVTPVLGETRTVLEEDGSTIAVKWTDSDIAVDPEGNSKFHVWENGVKGMSEATLNQDKTIATITCVFDENTSRDLIYSSCFAKQVDASGKPVVLALQNPGPSSFDPDADLLIGEDIPMSSQPDELLVNFTRPVALVKMTLKGLEVGESVRSVLVTSKSGKLTGSYDRTQSAFDFTDGEATIVVCPAGVTVGSDGTAPVYFVTAPVENEILEVEVYTSKGGVESDEEYHYKKEFAKGISFPANKLTRFTANLTGCEVVTPTDKYYTKVTSNDDLVDGRYLIVYEDGGLAFNGGLAVLDAVGNSISVEITNDGILSNEDTDAASFEIAFSNSSATIKSASGFFIGQTSNANGLKADETTSYSNTITINAQKDANIVSGGAYMRYNSTSGQTRFRYFKSDTYSNQKAIALYKYDGEYVVKKSADLSFEVTEFNAVAGGSFTAPALVNPYSVPVTWASSDDEIAQVASDGTVTIGVKTGTVTITASFAGNETYNSGSAYYTISVTAAPKTLANITKAETGVSVKDVTVVAKSGDNYVLKDATGLGLLYNKSITELAVGDLVDLKGDVTLYEDNNILEFTDNITISNKRTGSVVHGTAAEFDSVAEGLKTNTKVTFVHAKGVQDGRIITTSANNVLRLSAVNDATDGLNVDISGYTIGYSSEHTNHTIIATALGVDPDFAELSVDEDELTWLCNETDTKTVNVTVNANGGFTYSTTDMDWATIEVVGNVISVTPNGQNSNATPNSGTILLTHSVDNTKTVEITCEQGEYVNLVTAIATFTPAASGGMETTAGAQTGVRRNVTATISNGILASTYIAIYKNATLTISVPSGARITRIEFTCTSENPISGFADVDGLVKNEDNGVWTGNSESVSFTAPNKQVRATAIAVTYSIAEDQLAKLDPTINASDKAIYVGDSVNIDATSDSEGTISYSIVSGGSYITLNTTTGAVTGIAEGTAVVKVSVAASGDFVAGSKNVNVSVTNKPSGSEEIVMSEQGFSNGAAVSSIQGDNCDISFTDGSTATAYYTSGSGVRIYGGGSVTVTSKNNKKIKKIEFTYSGSSYAPSADGYSVSSGSLTTGVNSTWTGTETPTSVTVSRASGSGHWRLQKVKVTFAE